MKQSSACRQHFTPNAITLALRMDTADNAVGDILEQELNRGTWRLVLLLNREKRYNTYDRELSIISTVIK